MIFEIVLLVVLWGATVARLPTLLRDARQRALWASLFAGSLAETSAIPAVSRTIGRPIVAHLLAAVSTFVLLRFLAVLTGQAVRRWQWALTGAVLVTLVVLDTVAGRVGPRPSGGPAAEVAFWVVLEGYLATVLIIGIVLFWSVARQAPPGLPRLGLRVIAAGWALIALSAAATAIPLVLGVESPETPDRYLQGAGIMLAVGGALVPAGRRARAVLAEYRSLLVLRPLWTAMRDAFPEVILFSPRRAVVEMAGVDDVRLRVYRRVIEIRDGMLALRPYLCGVLPETPEAEAAAIAEALRRRADGLPPAGDSPGFAVVGPEMADEVAWLSRVSRAYRRARVTRRSAARTPRPSGSVH